MSDWTTDAVCPLLGDGDGPIYNCEGVTKHFDRFIIRDNWLTRNVCFFGNIINSHRPPIKSLIGYFLLGIAISHTHVPIKNDEFESNFGLK